MNSLNRVLWFGGEGIIKVFVDFFVDLGSGNISATPHRELCQRR
jgi:hypothetical protein